MKPAKTSSVEQKFRKELVRASLSLGVFPSPSHLKDLPKLAAAFERRGGYDAVKQNYLQLVGKALKSAEEEVMLRILLEKARAGDADAHGRLVEHFRQLSFVLARSILPEKMDPESGSNEALAHLSSKIFDHDDLKGSVKSFGFTVLKNKLGDLRKYWHRRTSFELPQQNFGLQDSSREGQPNSLLPEYADPEDSLGKAERMLFLSSLALRVLRPEERTVLNLHLLEGWTLEETADELGLNKMPLRSKKSRVLRIKSRALDKLRSALNSD